MIKYTAGRSAREINTLASNGNGAGYADGTREAGLAKERPIIFGAESVRAILAGRKTQTRRLVQSPPPADWTGEFVHLGNGYWGWHDGDLSGAWRCPYGEPGGLLYVKETWCQVDDEVVYRADIPADGLADERAVRRLVKGGQPWKSPRFMPRSVSRLLLELAAVRVERVQGISLEDAMAEGFEFHGDQPSPRDEFSAAWEEINGKRAPWASNPWVWALSFCVVAPAEAAS